VNVIDTYHLVFGKLELGFKPNLEVVEEALGIHGTLVFRKSVPLCNIGIQRSKGIHPRQQVRLGHKPICRANLCKEQRQRSVGAKERN